jgi:hypothetical protein
MLGMGKRLSDAEIQSNSDGLTVDSRGQRNPQAYRSADFPMRLRVRDAPRVDAQDADHHPDI